VPRLALPTSDSMFIGRSRNVSGRLATPPAHPRWRVSGPLARGLSNLVGLFAATFSVVLKLEGDLVARVERPDACRLEGSRMDKRSSWWEALSVVREVSRSRMGAVATDR
jgi:hypothetical protein